jgi:drug/metabolite transporter (DMT)-like permease
LRDSIFDVQKMKIFLYSSFALTAFAFNSILCRMALGNGEADAANFTLIRLVSGALTLLLIASSYSKTKAAAKSGHWLSAFLLFAYAICFSFAYVGLTAATGALILFGSVQLTMIAVSLVRGDRPSLLEWVGLAVAGGGLVYLLFPGLEAPPLVSSLLMASAGAAWGGYTLRGKGSEDPLVETAGNFVRSVPMIVLASIPLIVYFGGQLSPRGALLAVLSGAAASGVGYTVWYAALKHHTATRAAVLQLAVPVIAGVLAVLMLDEAATLRLAVAALLILGGIALTITAKKKAAI